MRTNCCLRRLEFVCLSPRLLLQLKQVPLAVFGDVLDIELFVVAVAEREAFHANDSLTVLVEQLEQLLVNRADLTGRLQNKQKRSLSRHAADHASEAERELAWKSARKEVRSREALGPEAQRHRGHCPV